MRTGPKEKKERALGVNLGLKASRSGSPKSALVRKPYRPGVHGVDSKRRRSTSSDFGTQLKEKQKFKINYGLKERQLETLFRKGISAGGDTRDRIFELLESRLDNVVFRLGLAPSRTVARQLVLHGHINVNNHKVDYPGFQLKTGDTVSVNPNSRDLGQFKNLAEFLKRYETPSWLLLDKDSFSGKIISAPTDIDVPFDVNLVVEFYSK